ncbi:MAG: 30S ribosomal protein S20 [Candidatus Abawacabacteria bacterium]|nr:30S ribosomal protein S20 [Candidatus Abawacabacteria bacterium]
MPVIKSVFKNVRVNERKRVINERTKDGYKSKMKEFNRLLADKKMSAAEKLLPALFKAFDTAAKKNVISQNSAARKKSSATKKLVVKK